MNAIPVKLPNIGAVGHELVWFGGDMPSVISSRQVTGPEKHFRSLARMEKKGYSAESTVFANAGITSAAAPYPKVRESVI